MAVPFLLLSLATLGLDNSAPRRYCRIVKRFGWLCKYMKEEDFHNSFPKQKHAKSKGCKTDNPIQREGCAKEPGLRTLIGHEKAPDCNFRSFGPCVCFEDPWRSSKPNHLTLTLIAVHGKAEALIHVPQSSPLHHHR